MDFKYDYEYLLHLINCCIHDTQPQEKPEHISFFRVLALGKLHEVANIAFLSVEKLEHKPPQEIYDEWKLAYYFSVERDVKQYAEREQLIRALHTAGIRTLEVQGTVMKQYYPQPELRMMSDIDFIVDADKLDAAGEAVAALGYTLKSPHEGELDAYNTDGNETEIHTEFFTEHMFNEIELRYQSAIHHPFEHAVPSQDDPFTYVIDDTAFYLFTLLHIIKHFETAGCGIRRILDIYFLKKQFAGKLDQAHIDRVMEENGFTASYNAVTQLEAMWFEGVAPSVDLSEAVHDVITSGNHGNNELFTRNTYRKNKREGAKAARLQLFWRYLFPPREYIYLSYPELREKNYSLLHCRLYRIVQTVKHLRFSHASRYLKTLFHIQ